MTENQVLRKYVQPYYEAKGYFVYAVDHARLPDVYMSTRAFVNRDVLAEANDVVQWMEIKCIHSTPRDGILRPDWRPGQLAWIAEQEFRSRGVNNVQLCLYFAPLVECRIYSTCKKEYVPDDKYTVLRRQSGSL